MGVVSALRFACETLTHWARLPTQSRSLITHQLRTPCERRKSSATFSSVHSRRFPRCDVITATCFSRSTPTVQASGFFFRSAKRPATRVRFTRTTRTGAPAATNVVERLSDVSGGLLAAANEGVPYETLVRGLRVLHLQHLELAARAEWAKQCLLPVLEMQEKSSETSPKHDTSTTISCVKVGVA